MKTYLVGGAVRDKLLGLPVQERDWVIVGTTPEALLAEGYKAVGKDFPVFLHPTSHEEYALARTERKIGKGYKGFICYSAPDVTLEEDLLRRDLTINAIAEDEAGHLIDPYGGQADLKAGILRHVSDAFSEDPVRVLRLARFAARFAGQGFSIAAETKEQLQKIVDSGELAVLVPERIWQELEKALAESSARIFFDVLAENQALALIFPHWQDVYQEDHLGNLQEAVKNSSSISIRLASLLQGLSEVSIKEGCIKLRLPKQCTELAILTAEYREAFKAVQTIGAEELLHFLEGLDAFRRLERFEDLLQVWESNVALSAAPAKAAFLRRAQQIANQVNVSSLIERKNLSGLEIKNALHLARVEALEKGIDCPS